VFSLKTVILAGGKGTRLRPLTYTRPKPLLPLAGEPAIAHLVKKLAQEGFHEIIITTNYFAERLRATLGDGSQYGAQIDHVEEATPLGTAGSVKNSEALIDDTFLVVQGDNQFDFKLDAFIEFHRKLGVSATLGLFEVPNPSEYGIAEVSDGHVVRFLEKPKPEECFSNLINTGLYLLEPEVLKLVPEGKPFDFSENLFPLMLQRGMSLGGFLARGFWVDIGDPESYLKANIHALDELAKRHTPELNRVVCGPHTSTSEGAVLRGPVCLAKDAKLQKGSEVGPYACVSSGVEVSEGARIARSIVYENTHIGMDSTLDSCVVAENCRIGRSVRIEAGTLVGAWTEVGDSARIASASNVGPWTRVGSGALLQGTVADLEKHLEKISELQEVTQMDSGLTGDEARVCAVLLEQGETDVTSIARLATMQEVRVQSALAMLQEKGIILCSGHETLRFALVK